MNRFGKISHHISMKDVKKKHLEEIVARKIEEIRIEEERKLHNEIYDKWKSNWRDELELEEGMTVAGMMKTTLSSEGDEVLDADDTKEINITWDDVSYARANNVDGVSAVFDVGPVNDPNTGVKYLNVAAGQMHPNGNGNNMGTSEGSGFNMGGSYARMNDQFATGYAPNTGPRYVTLAGTDTTNFSHMRITAIQGTGFEGGDGNGGNGGWGISDSTSLRVRYWLPGMTDFRYLSVNPQGQTTGNADVIVPFDASPASTPTNFTIEIPEYARNKDVRFQIYQPLKTIYYSNSAQAWGISNVSYQRKTPINVFVSLDSPEATSFVRLGGKESDPKKRRKKVEDILRAGQRYTDKTFDTNFPGSTTELSPEASPEISSPDQDVADTQQQNRDSMDQKTKLNYDISEKTDRLMKLLYDATKGQSGIDRESVKRAYSIATNPADYIGQTYTASDGKVYTVGGKGDFQRTRTYNSSIHDPRSPDYKPGAAPEYVKDRYYSQAAHAMINDIKSKLTKAFWNMDYSDRTERMSVQSDVFNALSVPNFDLDDKGNPIMASSLDLPMLDLLKSDEYRLKQEYQNRKSGRGNTVYNRDFPRGYTKGAGGMDYRGNYVKARGVKESLTYSKIKNKILKDIKPEFPPEPPPQIDPKTGMHPEYGKHADRYKKLDPHSANAMPPTGEPEIDAVVKKQKTKRTFNKIKKLDKT